MADLANGMAQDTWSELVTDNIVPALTHTGGASGMTFGYTDKAVWDPVAHELLFIGGDHAPDPCYPRFIALHEDTNRWEILPQPAWFPCPVGGAMHGYHHTALDAVGRVLYHRPFGGTRVLQRLDMTTGIWSELPAIPQGVHDYANNCCVGVDYFPERDTLVFASLENGTVGRVIEYSEGSGAWTSIAGDLPMGEYQHFAEYNPVHGVVWFGGGNGTNGINTHRLNADGTVTTMTPAPFILGVQQTIVTVDPTNGDYLVFNNAEEMHRYNVISDAWLPQPRPIIFDGGLYGTPVHGMIATPVATYGVTVIVKCVCAGPSDPECRICQSPTDIDCTCGVGDATCVPAPWPNLRLAEGNPCQVFLYKGAGPHIPDDVPPAPPTNLQLR